jgi:hypothetical protein
MNFNGLSASCSRAIAADLTLVRDVSFICCHSRMSADRFPKSLDLVCISGLQPFDRKTCVHENALALGRVIDQVGPDLDFDRSSPADGSVGAGDGDEGMGDGKAHGMFLLGTE